MERQLFIEVSSNQSRSCQAWNISVHEYSANEENEENHAGPLLHLFCPRYKHKIFTMPWKLNTVVIRVQAMTRTPPEYIVKWKSQVVRSNRLGPPTPAPNMISLGITHSTMIKEGYYILFSLLSFFYSCSYEM